MSFWKKIFGNKNEKISNKTESHFDQYRSELNELNLKSLSDLENLLKPLIRQTTKLDIQPASRLPENSQFESHFGGHPFFEIDEQWPKSRNGKYLDFVFQLFNSSELELPKNIHLIQFFYDWEKFPWDTKDDGWLVKIYDKVDKEKVQFIAKPNELEKSKFCKIEFRPTQTLPDWEGINLYGSNASKLSCVLNEDEPWDSYDKVVTKLIGEQDYQSQLGGYPKWLQGDATPRNTEGNPMQLLFQIDSEDNAGLMWGDVGLVYVFYDKKRESIELALQCH